MTASVDILDVPFELDLAAFDELSDPVEMEDLRAIEKWIRESRFTLRAIQAQISPGSKGKWRLSLLSEVVFQPSRKIRFTYATLKIKFNSEEALIRELYPEEVPEPLYVSVSLRADGGFEVQQQRNRENVVPTGQLLLEPHVRGSGTGLDTALWRFEEASAVQGLGRYPICLMVECLEDRALSADFSVNGAFWHKEVSQEFDCLRVRAKLENLIGQIDFSRLGDRNDASPPVLEDVAPGVEVAPRRESRGAAPGADLAMVVDTATIEGHRHLRYRFDYGGTSHSIYGPRFEMEPEEYQANLFREIEDLRDGVANDGSRIYNSESIESLAALGERLYKDLFVIGTSDLLAPEMKKKLQDAETLHVLSYESSIPWELIKPKAEDFWGVRLHLTRWLAVAKEPKASILVSRLAVIEAGKPSDTKPLVHADEELRFLSELAERRGVENRSLAAATHDKLRERLRGEDLGLIHFIGHGKLMDNDPEKACFLLEDGRGWRPDDLTSEIEKRVQSNRPLVFMNACQLGRPGWARTRLGGWVPKWIEAGCGAFVGPQWTIDDSLAFAFAKAFYEELGKGSTFGEAAWRARKGLGVMGLAFAVYAHPGGHCLLGNSGTRAGRPDVEDDAERLRTRPR